MSSTRTNIVLDNKLVQSGMKLTGIKTKKDLVNFALSELLRHEQQRNILNLKGKIQWHGDLQKSRLNRTDN